jgi:hypothetical protein
MGILAMSSVRRLSLPLALTLAAAFGGFATQAISFNAEADASIALNERLSALENQMAEVKADNERLKAMKADARSFWSPFAGPSNIVTAPFKVVNTAGETVFEVRDDSTGRYARLVSGNFSVQLNATKFVGLQVANNGKVIASLGVPEGRGVGLRFYKEDKQFVALAAKPDGGAALHIGNGTQNGIEADVDSSGSGTLNVIGDGGVNAIALNSKERRVITYNAAGDATTALGKSDKHNGGNITTYSSAGGVFSAGAATDGGGEACVIRQDNKTHCLGVGLPLR